LAGVKTEFFVVIKHGVHAFDPKSVYRPIEINPMLFWGLIFTCVIDQLGQATVLPFSGLRVTPAVKLVHSNRFRVKRPNVDFFKKFFFP